MTWNLFLDDERVPEETFEDWDAWSKLDWVVARSSAQALKLIEERGMPERMALDFALDKWGSDTVLHFLKSLRKTQDTMVPYRVHSSSFGAATSVRSFIQDVFKHVREEPT